MLWHEIPWGLTEVTPPALEPVSIMEVRNRLRISSTADDADLQALILAARRQVEKDLAASLVSTVWDFSIDAFPEEKVIPVPRWPLISVGSITSYDTADVVSTFSASKYRVDIASKPGRVVLQSTAAWPSGLRAYNGGVIRCTAGFSNAAAKTVSSITRSSSTATVTTSAAHGYATGNRITIAGADQAEYNGTFEITVTGATTFTFTVTGTPVTPATGVMTASNLGIPESYRLALMFLVGHWWDRVRSGVMAGASEAELPFAYRALINDGVLTLA